MADRKYYALCDSNCKFETMTKEQILTAIMQAVNEGTIGDIDAGFITTVKTINGRPLKFFVGSQSEYEALTAVQRENLFAIITNDTTKEALENAIADLRNDIDGLQTALRDGSFVVERASHASTADSATHASTADSATHATTARMLNFNEFEGDVLGISETGLYLVERRSKVGTRFTDFIFITDLNEANFGVAQDGAFYDNSSKTIKTNDEGTILKVIKISEYETM